MSFFKNIGVDIDIIGLEDTPKPGRVSKVNINGEDILFNTIPFTCCSDCVFNGICSMESSIYKDGLYINGVDVTKKYHKILGPYCGYGDSAVVFVKID